ANARGGLGTIYDMIGDCERAVDYYGRLLGLQVDQGNKKGMTENLLRIGGAFRKMEAYTESLDYLNQALLIAAESGDLFLQSRIRRDQSSVYLELGEEALAVERAQQAHSLALELGRPEALRSALLQLGLAYEQWGQLTEAKRNILQSIALGEIQQDTMDLAQGLSLLARLLLAEGNPAEAIRQGKRALELGEKLEDIELQIGASHHLYQCYRQAENYSAALLIYEKWVGLRDLRQNSESQKVILRTQLEADFERKEALISLENEQRIATETQKRKNQQVLSLAIGIGLLLISLLSIRLQRRLRVTQKQKKIIEQQKVEVEASKRFKEEFVANMSHEIRTPMHAIIGMTQSLRRQGVPPEQASYLEAIGASAEHLTALLNDILDLSKLEAGKLRLNLEPLDPSLL
ncbi:MAG: histidine kinase dimerization/phospho-acceptor domain-containing protein, partial [Bacteroidota bacterium]